MFSGFCIELLEHFYHLLKATGADVLKETALFNGDINQKILLMFVPWEFFIFQDELNGCKPL